MNWKFDFSPETSAVKQTSVAVHDCPSHSLREHDSIVESQDNLHMMNNALCG